LNFVQTYFLPVRSRACKREVAQPKRIYVCNL
jgi:hypothetical protein